MTAKTSQKLADAARLAGFEELARRAEADEFHDFLSPHEMPSISLDRELTTLIKTAANETQRLAATRLRIRHHEGEFDADLTESDDWAESEEGKAAFRKLMGGEG